jgi:hypothetical protein
MIDPRGIVRNDGIILPVWKAPDLLDFSLLSRE